MTFAGNPYVGPRTFGPDEADRFFGREQEARDLLSLVISQRLVLFYAQSGAGKSSLINARLIPWLRKEGFAVLPVGRVSGELPAGVDRVPNIFLFNLMLSLDQGRDGRGGDPTRLLDLSFSRFLGRLTSDDGKTWYYDEAGLVDADAPQADGTTAYSEPNYVLIIDQFEEIVTVHPELLEERGDFFSQLDTAMRVDPRLWVVLTLREDHVAALDPFAQRMTDQMRARFYMERMGGDAALDAIRRPAELGKRPFAASVAEELRDRLRQVRVPGQETTVAGPYVEPVQLQAVCYQFWERLKDRPSGPITEKDLDEAGNVERALADYYEQVLADVLAEPNMGVSEAQLRDWFSSRLITAGGTRGFAPQIGDFTAGLPNTVVRLLERKFLVRRETRAGGVWYELVHDTFVPPILRSNRQWSLRQSLPEIENFTVVPKVVSRGVKVTARWQVKNAEILRLDPVGLALNGSQGAIELVPERTTAFRLNAERKNQPPVISAAQNVVVMEPPAALQEGVSAVLLQPSQPSRLTLLIGPEVDRLLFFSGAETTSEAWLPSILVDDPEARLRYLDSLKVLILGQVGAEEGTVRSQQMLVGREVSEMTVSELAILSGYFDAAVSHSELLRTLAAQPASVYITASFYTFLEESLRRAGKQPVTEVCRWSESVQGILSSLEADPKYEPHAASPLVYHLYGLDAYPASLVLSEEDYLAFLGQVRAERERVPIAVRYALAATFDVVLGFDVQSWAFKALYHGLLTRTDRSRRQYGGLWQIDSPAERSDLDIRSLQTSARKAGFDIFWSGPEEVERWIEKGRRVTP